MDNRSDVETLQVSSPTATVNQLVEFEAETGIELAPAERLLLVTDGTVTHMLEALTRGPVAVVIVDRDETGGVLHRQVRLETDAGAVLLWAESTIHVECLPSVLRGQLVNGDIGIGQALRDARIDTHRDIGSFGYLSSAHDGFPAFIQAQQDLIRRTYRVHANGVAMMTITEYLCRLGKLR